VTIEGSQRPDASAARVVARSGPAAGLTVHAMLLDRDLTLRLGSRLLPSPRPGEALVRVEWAGICGSDLHVLRTGAWVSYWPATLGHEVIGVIEACPGGELAAGQRVVVDSRVPCWDCESCAVAPNLCEHLGWLGEALPGGFESHLVAPVRGLVACPPELEPAIGVLSEPLAVAMHAVARLPQPPSRTLVIGYGPVGALVHLELARRWPQVTVAVREPDSGRRMLAAAFGADVGDGAERACWQLVVDAAGYPGSLRDAISAAANGGTVLAVALGHSPVELIPAGIVESELTILGSNGFGSELPTAVRALADDPDRWRPLISEAVLLEDAADRLRELVDSPAPGKVVIRP
jgi:threonine dehydrogenase-like Zn-dependent dehydrogenase